MKIRSTAQLLYFLVLNFVMLSAQYSVLAIFLGVVFLLRRSSARLMFHYFVVFWFLPIFCCSISVPVFRRCSVFRGSVFRCSWYYSMRVSEGEDGFINSTWRPWFLRKQHQHGYYWNMYCVFEKVELSFFQGNTVNTMLKPYQILRLEQEYT